jgi:hypothetical protein
MPTPEWAEYLRLVRSGVPTTVAATVVLEQHRRTRRTGGRPRAPREHGTERGYWQHRADHAPACPPCRAAHTAHNLAARRAS